MLTGTSSRLKIEAFLLGLVLKNAKVFFFQSVREASAIVHDRGVQHHQVDVDANLRLLFRHWDLDRAGETFGTGICAVAGRVPNVSA